MIKNKNMPASIFHMNADTSSEELPQILQHILFNILYIGKY